jgi:hypothetical protein
LHPPPAKRPSKKLHLVNALSRTVIDTAATKAATEADPVATQVVFRFGESSEVRYVERIPEYGERFAHGGATWEVVAVERSGEYITTCVLLPVASSRADAHALATDLLERTHAVDSDQIAWNLPRPRT